MRKFFAACAVAVVLASGAWAQGGGAKKGPDPAVVGDAELEKEALHNLEVAKHYFKLKKAYVAALARSEEIVAGYPNFTRLDYALYIAGMSNLHLSEGKGRQKSQTPPDKLREEARLYLSRLVTEFPDSEFRKRADEELRALGGPAAEAGRKP
jgi:outer membrane protein assembly factor BamD (BamD/ComL family)